MEILRLCIIHHFSKSCGPECKKKNKKLTFQQQTSHFPVPCRNLRNINQIWKEYWRNRITLEMFQCSCGIKNKQEEQRVVGLEGEKGHINIQVVPTGEDLSLWSFSFVHNHWHLQKAPDLNYSFLVKPWIFYDIWEINWNLNFVFWLVPPDVKTFTYLALSTVSNPYRMRN